jgi:hypothetical protein
MAKKTGLAARIRYELQTAPLSREELASILSVDQLTVAMSLRRLVRTGDLICERTEHGVTYRISGPERKSNVEDFAMTEDGRLIIFGLSANAKRFTKEQSERMAALFLKHYERPEGE